MRSTMTRFTDLGFPRFLADVAAPHKDQDPLTAEENEALFSVLNDALKRIEVLEKEVDLLKRGICEFS